jgi:hypothetical protein
MFRSTLIVGVCVALICTGVSLGADGSSGQSAPTVSQRPDGRHVPDGADVPVSEAVTVTRPDDRADRFTPGASSATSVVTGRPDGRLVPDSVDARNAVVPAVIRTDENGTISFDWLAELIVLTVGGVALVMGGLLVFRHRGPAAAR